MSASDSDEQFLARWIGTQRQAEKRGKLSADRRRRLDDMSGWNWDGRDDWRTKVFAQKDATWESRLRAIASFVAVNGRLPSRTSTDQVERQLGEWIGKQRQALRSGELSDDRFRRLNMISGWQGKDGDGSPRLVETD